MLLIRWFLSGTVRQAVDLRKQVLKLLAAQEDILKPDEIQAIKSSVGNLGAALDAGADKKAIESRMTELEKVAGERLRPYPNANTRENIEVILVAIAVAMSIRTFFLQPFKIPTGSMQPTLFGINHTKLRAEDPIPGGWSRFREAMAGVSYVHEVAPEDGRLERIGTPWPKLFFSIFQTYTFNGKTHVIWFPPEYGAQTLAQRAEAYPNQEFAKGQDIFKLKVMAGDHLFVDRLTYNFRRPKRGEIIVFSTDGIRHDQVPQDLFYIKRLVALPGERVGITRDQHLVINGQRLDAATPRFENLYTFSTNSLNTFPNMGAQFYGNEGEYTGHFPIGLFSNGQEYTVEPKRFLAMGDHTSNSLDSRYWGGVREENVIGKSAFVYWPLSKRFGWSHR